jgi:hypothetical protein
VAGVEEERRVRAFEGGPELADRLDHVAARGVLAHDHLEPQLLQRFAQVLGVVRRIAQRGGRVLVVADEERHALDRGGRDGREHARQHRGEAQRG